MSAYGSLHCDDCHHETGPHRLDRTLIGTRCTVCNSVMLTTRDYYRAKLDAALLTVWIGAGKLLGFYRG